MNKKIFKGKTSKETFNCYKEMNERRIAFHEKYFKKDCVQLPQDTIIKFFR